MFSLVAVAAGLSAGGCVERLLKIRTNPPGAGVTVNGETISVVGENGELVPAVTPVDVPFVYYGTFDIRVRHPDALSASRMVSLSAPFYAYPPIDFFVEALSPVKIRDHYLVEFDLEPIPDLEDHRAEEMLRRMRETQTQLLGLDGELAEPVEEPIVDLEEQG